MQQPAPQIQPVSQRVEALIGSLTTQLLTVAHHAETLSAKVAELESEKLAMIAKLDDAQAEQASKAA